MAPYWFLFFVSVFPSLLQVKLEAFNRIIPIILISILIIMIMGLRQEVGGDWYTYLKYYDLAKSMTLREILVQGDPG